MSDSDDLDEIDEPCDSCGSTENVSEDPSGENLCHECYEDAWL